MPERTTIVLPPALKKKAMARARNEGISFGEFVRQSVKDKLAAKPGKRKQGKRDPLFEDVPVYTGPVPADISENHDKYLYDEPWSS